MKRLSKADEEMICKFYGENRNVKAIAECVGCAVNTVYLALRRNNIPTHKAVAKNETAQEMPKEQKPKFDFKQHTSKYDAIQINNADEYNCLAKALDTEGFKWNTGDNFMEYSPQDSRLFGDTYPQYINYNMGEFDVFPISYRNLYNFSDYDWSEYEIKPKFRIEDYPGKVAMHCLEELQAKIFCKYLDAIGRKWANGMSYTNNSNWKIFQYNTCYLFNEGRCGNFKAEQDYAKMLEFSDYDWTEYETVESETPKEQKPKFEFGKHTGEHDIICVKNEHEYNKLAKILDKENFKWNGGETFTEWSPYNSDDVVYGIPEGCPCFIWYNIGFNGLPESSRYSDYTVFNFSDYDWTEYDSRNEAEKETSNSEKPESNPEKSKWKRYSHDRRYIEMARVAAHCGTCKRRNYGAIIVKDNRVISMGYTGSPTGEPNCCDSSEPCYRQKHNIPSGQQYEACKSAHAEMNALIKGNPTDMQGATLYLSGYDLEKGEWIKDAKPCNICLRMIKNAGVAKVVNESNMEE